jgi:glycerol-3-phosphate dehydrogenase
LYVPSAGSTSPIALIKKIKKLAEKNGVLFLLATKVTAINPGKDGFDIITLTRGKAQTRNTDILINTAGLYADEVAKMVNPHVPYTIEPIRGEFFVYDKSIRKDVWMNGMHVYQPPYCYMTKNGQIKILVVSAKKLPLLLKKGNVVITAGIHLSPAYEEVNGKYVLKNKITISPLKTSGLGKENYISNLHRAKDYIEKICYFFPNVKVRDLIPSHTGIMSVLKDHRDFIIERDKKFPKCINLVGMESPAWTASFAIAKYVKNLIPN